MIDQPYLAIEHGGEGRGAERAPPLLVIVLLVRYISPEAGMKTRSEASFKHVQSLIGPFQHSDKCVTKIGHLSIFGCLDDLG
jgi:hypothetical protein